MTLNDLSSEQQEFVHLALSGKNVLCDACIGSGKTSTINVLCDAYPPERRILYLTYNRLLKLDAKDKIKNGNVLVQNYHGFASLLLNKKGIRNCGQGEQLAMVLEKKIPIPPIDTLIIDEYQDINDEIAELLKYIRSQNPGLQIVAVGDMKQKSTMIQRWMSGSSCRIFSAAMNRWFSRNASVFLMTWQNDSAISGARPSTA